MRKIKSNDVERIYNSQNREIKKKFGKDAADNADYGWSVNDYMVDTRIYGCGMLFSYCIANKIIHFWNEWRQLRIQ